MTIADPSDSPDAPLDQFRADNVYLGADHARNERRTWIVAGICAATLAAQVAGGVLFHSMALTAAGLHMGAHVAALAVSAFAYAYARRHADDPRFAFGAGKVGYLAGFANAVVLGVTALAIASESLHRLIAPEAVDFGSALPLAVAGLAVTLVCVWLLQPASRDRHDHDQDGDLNIAAAHLHLTADALVGVLTIAGLIAGRRLGWTWADPIMGLIGAGLVAQFAWRLLRRACPALLDVNPSPELTRQVRTRLECGGERVADLHLWRLGPGHHAAMALIVASDPQSPQVYRARLADLAGLSHVILEVRRAV